MQREDLRRAYRMRICCRADVRERMGIWTAVTEDFCARGCGLVTSKFPRVGTILDLTLWSDLFPEPLEVVGTAAWVSDRRVGVAFVATATRGRLAPAEWACMLLEHGKVVGPEPIGSEAPRLVPVMVRRAGHAVERKVTANDGRAHPDGDILVLPIRHG